MLLSTRFLPSAPKLTLTEIFLAATFVFLEMTSVFDLNQPVVLDLGSGLTKAGFAGSPEPSVVMGTIVGHPKLPRVMPSSGSVAPHLPTSQVLDTPTADVITSPTSTRAQYASAAANAATSLHNVVVGDKLHTLSGILRLESPMERGAVKNWPAVEEIWRHIINDQLKVSFGEHPMLVTENPLNPRRNRERMAEFFFESMHVPSLYVSIPAILSLYASGRTTGLVLDVGDTVSVALPVAEGHCDTNAITRIDVGGRDVTDRLATLMRKSGTSLLASSSEKQAVRRIKERHAYVAANPREEEHKFIAEGGNHGKLSARFDLPDGNVISVGAERFRSPEILFNPSIVAAEYGGVQDCLKRSIDSVDLELRTRMYSSIVLAGGCTKFRGFGDRLVGEMRSLAPSDTKIRIHAPPDRLYTAYTGGSILASLATTFRSMAVSRAEYFESGAAILHRKTL